MLIIWNRYIFLTLKASNLTWVIFFLIKHDHGIPFIHRFINLWIFSPPLAKLSKDERESWKYHRVRQYGTVITEHAVCQQCREKNFRFTDFGILRLAVKQVANTIHTKPQRDELHTHARACACKVIIYKM